MSSLLSLDLINCSLSNDEKYRDNVFELLTNIVYLDGFDREDNELEGGLKLFIFMLNQITMYIDSYIVQYLL